MHKKNLIIVCAVFAALVVLVVAKKNLRTDVPDAQEAVDFIEPVVLKTDVEDIAIWLGAKADQSDGVYLAKNGNDWVVKSFYDVYANEAAVDSILEKINQLKGELRSDNKEVLADYGIADDRAVYVRIGLKDAQSLDVVVGTRKVNYQNNFVRVAGSNAVYLVEENLLAALGVRGEEGGQKLEADAWIDKRIARINADSVSSMTIAEQGQGAQEIIIDLKREVVDGQKKWQSGMPYVFGLSATKIKEAIAAWNNVYAREVLDAREQEVFDRPAWTGTFTLEDGGEVKIVCALKSDDKANYYVKREGTDYYYVVPVASFDGRRQQQGNIFAPNPLKVEEADVSEIKIRDVTGKKEFHAIKKAPAEPAAESLVKKDEGREVKEEVFWQASDAHALDAAKVSSVINLLKGLNPEAVAQPVSSLDDILRIRIVKGQDVQEYTVSRDISLSYGKECHLLKAGAGPYGYCIQKSQVTALQDVLP